MNIYVSPSAVRGVGYSNRYFVLLKRELSSHYTVLDAANKPCLAQSTALLKNAFKADIFLLSFVETIAFHKLAPIQFLIASLALAIMKWRHRKVVFIFHNPHPHKGENFISRSLTRQQFRCSCLVIAHSTQAANCAKEHLRALGCDEGKVEYFCHPVIPHSNVPSVGACPVSCDVLLWGNILPYKGVLEFVSCPAVKASGLNIKIVGRCKDSVLAAAIEAQVNDPANSANISFENKLAEFDELEKLIPASKYVLFPYLPGSVSSSGVLMDTLAMGGCPVGPNLGAFADLSSDGVCFVYDNEAAMLDILRSDRRVAPERIASFVEAHTWPSYAAFLHRRISASL